MSNDVQDNSDYKEALNSVEPTLLGRHSPENGRIYDLPNGEQLSLSAEEFGRLVEWFRTLKTWRDDRCNKNDG